MSLRLMDDLYASSPGKTQFRWLSGVIVFVAIALALAPSEWVAISRADFLAIVCVSTFLTLLFRSAAEPALLRFAGYPRELRILLVGGGPNLARIKKVLSARIGYKLRCWMPRNTATSPDSLNPGSDDLQSLLARYRPHDVIVVCRIDEQQALSALPSLCRKVGASLHYLPEFDDGLRAGFIHGIAVMTAKRSAFSGVNLRIKQLIDLALAIILAISLAPLMAIIWLVIRLDSKGPSLIVQPRLGYRGRIFRIYKFRTMHHNVDESSHQAYIAQFIKNGISGDGKTDGKRVFKLVNDKRITRVGRILRRYSLDELPQIFNVLKLEMSIVGPRPSLAYELDSYQDWHKERLEAVPGLTGVWQVSGRSALTFDEMVGLDVEYLRNWTPSEDFRVMLKTIPVVLRGTGH